MTEPIRASGLPWARLNVRTGWDLAASLSSGLAGGDAIALGKPGQRPIADSEPLGSFGGRRLPRGLAIATDGRLYVADPIGRVILTAQAGDAAAPRPADAPPEWPFVPLWPARPLPPAPGPHDLAPPPGPPADPFTLVRPLALALTPEGDLVIVDAGANGFGRVLVLNLAAGRLRHVIPMNEPVAVSIDPEGRACIADAGARRLVRFDRFWRRDPGYPHASVPPLDGLAHLAHACPERAAPGCVCEPLPAEPDLWFIAKGRVQALTGNGLLWSAPLPDSACLLPPALQLSTEGLLSWPDPALAAHDRLPLPGFTVDRGGRLVGTAIALLARPRRIELPRSGTAQLSALDGGREGFAWDRIVLDAEIPERTRLLVSTFATDAVLEPAQLPNLPDSVWSAPLEIGPADPPESLVQSPGGRYLWLRLEMFGDGARTPRIAGLDIFAPRRSSLAELPAPFREDADSAAFLDRFLSYFDTVFAEIAAKNARIPAFFDPDSVPEGPFLDWLGSWFDITFLPEWPEATRRAMVAQAIEMYRRRGTVAGLRQMLQWHTGLAEPVPAVIEHFRLTGPIAVAGYPLLPGDPAHAFTIVLPASAAPDATARDRLDRVIVAAIPAHTRYELRLVQPGIAVGRQSTLGVDMLIGSIAPQPLGQAQLGGDAVFPAGRTPPRLAPVTGEPRSCPTRH